MEFETASAVRIQRIGFGVGRGDEIGFGFIERIDQGDKARGLVAIVGGQCRDAVDQYGVEARGNGEIIGWTQGLGAQVVKAETGQPACVGRDGQGSAGNVQC